MDCKGEPAPKKQVLFFHGVTLIDYLQKGKTITGEIYASLLEKLKPELAKISHICRKIKSIFIQTTHQLRFQLLDHLPYLPDLTPSDFGLGLSSEDGDFRRMMRQSPSLTIILQRKELFGRVREIGVSMGKVCRIFGKIKKNQKRCLVSLSETFQTIQVNVINRFIHLGFDSD